jgi:TolB-like protein/AraC-like DNA-binding protein
MNNLPSMDEQFIRKIDQYIDDNLDNEHFSVEDLAAHVSLSRSMLHRKLVKLTGKSASDLIMEKRLLKAKELLENNVATASEIAYRVGFNSPSYFTKVFKNYFHVSPGDVRKGTMPPVPQKIEPLTRKSVSRLSSIALIVLIVVVIAGTGVYFIFREEKPIEKSIAILPFDNLSSDDENQYFADGIVEDLLNRISKIEGLKVISRTSSEMFRDKGDKTIPEIARLLGVSYILEGTVQRYTDKVRINIQLIDAKKDDHILSKQYDRNISEIFTLQSEIAGQIASELSFALTDQQVNALMQNQTTNLKAFEYKQIGRYHLNKRTRDDLFLSIKYFRLAIEEDPYYALAYAELADTYFILPWYGHMERQEARDSSVYLALRALELDRNLGEAHTVLAAVYNEFDRKYDDAEKEFLTAIELRPNHSPAYQYYSEFLCTAGKLKEARELIDKAVQLDPYSFIIRFASSYLYYKQENFIQALAENKICQELVSEHASAVSLEYKIYLKLGNEEAALVSYKKLGRILGEWTPEQADSVYRMEGFNGLFRWQLQDGRWDHESDKSKYYAMLGEDEKALDMLELAVNEGTLFPFNLSDLEYKNIRSNPRFIAIRKKMGLPALEF